MRVFRRGSSDDAASDRFPLSTMNSTIEAQTTSTKARPASKWLVASRKFLLPLLLTLAVTVLILSFIYAYCAAKPHSTAAAEASSSAQGSTPYTNTDDSIWGYVKRDDYYPPQDNYPTPASTATPAPAETTTSAGQSVASTTDAADSDVSVVALSFYSFTVPCIQLVLFAIELISYWHSPAFLASRAMHFLITAFTSLLLAGWIIQTAIWTHCEFISPDSALCPPQVKEHRMGGIYGVSVAKVVLSWLIVSGLAVHLGLLGLAASRSRRTWTIEGGGNEFTEAKGGHVAVDGLGHSEH